MQPTPIQRTDPSDDKSDASPSGPGLRPRNHPAMAPELHDRIAQRAYELARRRGLASGRELEDWLEAERQVVFGQPRNTPPDNPSDPVKTRSNE